MGKELIRQRPEDLCLAQFLLALEILRDGGTFIIKLEDTFTYLGVALIFLMSEAFINVAIHKPESALPGERFVICRWKKPSADESVIKIERFLRECNEYRMEQDLYGSGSEIFRFCGLERSAVQLNDPRFINFLKQAHKR